MRSLFGFLVTMAVVPLSCASPVIQDQTNFCAEASGYLFSSGAQNPIDKWCTKKLQLAPTTMTITSTSTESLTAVFGIPTTEYQPPAPPGTTTIALQPTTLNGTTTKTSTSTTYTFTNEFYTNTVTTEKDVACTTTRHYTDVAIEKACECLGATTPTKTSTLVITTTGRVTTITQTVTQVYGATTTYAPTATVTAMQSTLYANTITKVITTTSTRTFDQPALSDKTITTTQCTSTLTALIFP